MANLSAQQGLFNYLNKSTVNLSVSEQIKLNQLTNKGHYLSYEIAELNPLDQVFVDRTLSINFTEPILSNPSTTKLEFTVDFVNTKPDGSFYWMG